MGGIFESVVVEMVANAVVALLALGVAVSFVGSRRRRLQRFMGAVSSTSVSVETSKVRVNRSDEHDGFAGFQGRAVPVEDLDGVTDLAAAFGELGVFHRLIALFPFVPKSLHVVVGDHVSEDLPGGSWIALGTGIYNSVAAFSDDVLNKRLPPRIVYYNDGRDTSDKTDPGVRAFVRIKGPGTDDLAQLAESGWVRSPKESYALVQRVQFGGTREEPEGVIFVVAGLDALGTRLAARALASNARSWAKHWEQEGRPASCAWVLTVPGPDSEPVPDWNLIDNMEFEVLSA